MHYIVRSRSALAFVCAVACLFFFYAMSTPLRRVIAHEERRAVERKQPAPRGQTDVPADLRAAIEETRARKRREVSLEVDDAGAQNPLTTDLSIQQQQLRASDGGSKFGYSVLVNSETAIVGAPAHRNGSQRTGAAISEGYAPVSGNTATVQHSLVRNLLSGASRDCDHSDFQLVATNDAATLPGATLGTPAPENTNSPVQRNASIEASLLDMMQPSSASPNRVRNGAADASEPANSTRGTLKIRRKFTNTTGASVTRLRFRIVDITTTPRLNSTTADLRVLPGSGGVTVILSNGASVPLIALTREEPPVQSAHGGGFNTTLSATLAQAIPHKASIYVEFNLGVIEDGNFSFRVNVEALTNPPANSPANAKPDTRRKASKSMKTGTPPATP